MQRCHMARAVTISIAAVVSVVVSDLLAQQVTIDFEDIASSTSLRDQYVGRGLRVSGSGEYTGFIMSEGEGGIANFGNTPTHVMHVGRCGQPTRLEFVDPRAPEQHFVADNVSFILGDGHPDSETVYVTFLNEAGSPIGSESYSTGSNGLIVTAGCSLLGESIAAVVLEATCESGSTIDELSFYLQAESHKCVPFKRGNTNADARIDIADAIFMLRHLFAQAGPLKPPFGECGVDPSEDTLDCASFAPCQ